VKSIRTYHPRRGRLSGRHHDALGRLLPEFGLPADGPVTAEALFGAEMPLVVEIGSGMGEATATMAQADRGRGYLAAEIHTPGVANLLAMVEERGLTNVRVAFEDALETMRRVPPGTLAAIHVFFPDPWPKARHHKRRLIQPKHVAVLASRLAADGLLWCATDWPGYADAMVETLDASPLLLKAELIEAGGGAHVRPPTKFEKRGHDAGRAIADLRYTRR
jgi:tRNA (guanine-N7-)-methyltransferase